MSVVTIDPQTKLLLSSINDVAELRDAEGNVLGTFHPSEHELYERAKKLFDIEEVQRRIASRSKGHSLNEFYQEILPRKCVERIDSMVKELQRMGVDITCEVKLNLPAKQPGTES